eukprot:maker-scaffold400_size182785-snap-gene-0.21 protein:Tk02293 transcript:maker-scaffold400_size182785-snap-gene-0.21-mRNA-1 annotation:"PREDICTED: contactin-like"
MRPKLACGAILSSSLCLILLILPAVISQDEYEDVEIPEDTDYAYTYDNDPSDDEQQDKANRNRNRDPNPFRSNVRNPSGGFRGRNPNSGTFRGGEDDIFDDDDNSRTRDGGDRRNPLFQDPDVSLRPDFTNRLTTSTRNPFRGFSNPGPRITTPSALPPLIATTPFPNRFGGGFQPLPSTEDPFRRSNEAFLTTTVSSRFRPITEDPYELDPRDPFGRDQDDMNQFQNNEIGDPGRPGNPFGIPPSRTRPQVDEFGNPLEDIRSVDTTRFELGEGIDAQEVRCPRNWERFKNSCYKFTRSPIKRWDDARMLCQAYRHQDQDHADLASVDTLGEHRFIVDHLNLIDPQHRRWYISTRQEDQNRWVNLGDGSQMLNLQPYFLKPEEWGESIFTDYKKDYLVYSFSYGESRWGFQPVFGHEEYLYICEMPIEEVTYLMTDERTQEYGQPIGDPRFYPMGPYFIRQPNQTVFNVGRRRVINDVSLLCIATGWPTPTYKWFKEGYKNDSLVSEEVDVLQDRRVTISGGQLIINNPNAISDRGKYFCTARNQFGTIRSRSVSIAFGFIGEFILRRSKEVGSENWGKAISCDPPQYFPDVKFYWARDYFPNFVEEDRRVMVSNDGYIYFSALEKIDQGNYSCSVQSAVSNNGRNGPFFQLEVSPHPNYQQLRFPQNFPKAFPEAPVAGDDVRLECIAFGYPVPHYNWTRINADIPDGAIVTNYNRVLILPRVRVEDQGEYICRAHNDKVSITGNVVLSIQSRPVFTISIGDMHVDERDDVTWTCEAFGIPDVLYEWLKNGDKLRTNDSDLAPEDRGRYEIRDNVLIIRQVRRDRDEGMYQCRAYNELDSRYSSGQLRVLAFAPTFAKVPLEPKTFAAEGGNVTLRCKPEGAPQPQFTWRKDGNRIASSGKYIIYDNGNIYINRVNVADTGTYTCEAANEYGKAESSGKIIVKLGPSFASGVKPNPRVIAASGETVELRCRAEADQFLDMAYSWRLNGLIIRYFEDEEEERILTLKNAPGNRLDGSSWFTSLTDHQRLLQSSSWFQGSYFQYTKGTGDFNKFRRGYLDGYLKIVNVSYAEAGFYECMVDTAVGKIYASSELIVHGPPGPPGGVSALSLTSRSGTIVWTDGAIYGRQVQRYRIDGRTLSNMTWLTLADQVAGEEIQHLGARAKIHGRRQVVLRNKLSPFAAYQFRVAGYNDLGLGQFSEPSPSYNTQPDKPLKAPRNVRGGGGKTGDLTILWDPLPKHEQNAPGIYYRLYYRRVGVDEERDFQSKTLKNLGSIGLYVVMIHKKYFYTTHEVKVQAFNDLCEAPDCDGPTSDPVVIFSAEDMPQVAPTQVGARPFNSTAINVTWIAIPDVREKIRGKLIGHRIKYWRDDLNEITESQYLLSRSTEPHATIIGLQPNSYYWVRVMAYNAAGPGPESERFLERTFKLRPQKPPTAVQVYGINPSAIRVTWRYVAPSVEEEPLTGYKVRVWESDRDVSEANDTVVYIGNKLEAAITDLTPGKTYYLRVLAFSQGGEGKMSSPSWQFQMGDPDALNLAPVVSTSMLISLLLPVSILVIANFNSLEARPGWS